VVLKNQRTNFWPVLVVLKILNKSNISSAYKKTGSFMKTIGALTGLKSLEPVVL
jgi:hypothetical protein